ncbi:MAG: ABC transporter permease [Armatimonadetes bacterium]|nr:ABC transporter permease [Armatimonadota bacterium]
MKRKNAVLVSAGAFLVVLAVFAVFGPQVGHGYTLAAGKPFSPPSSEFWLGTDQQGRDIFARLAYGARLSLFVGLSVQVVSLAVGIFVGVTGVFGPAWIRVPLMRLTDAMFAFPDILLAILIIGVFGTGLVPVIVALSVTAWPAVARLVRTQVASLKDREFFVASQALGAGTVHLVLKHVLPHLWGVLLAVSMVDVAGTILAESSLSFLGIGVQPPEPTWGNMINDARVTMNTQPVMLLWPCLILSLTVFALNFLGDEVRALVDPRSR